VPFPDECPQVVLAEHQPGWPTDFDALAMDLHDALGDAALSIDHVGSTSVPGLPAKDCINVQVRVRRSTHR
jgi:GrpB-like predicted nucleotidyltransferase (UPF0157 family)